MLDIFCGGNMIMDIEKIPLYSYLCWQYCRYAKKKCKKIIFAYVGVGDIKTKLSRSYWKKALNYVDFISVRDGNSKMKLQNLFKKPILVDVWYDPVFMLKNMHCEFKGKNIAINIYINDSLSKEIKTDLENTYICLINMLKNQYNVHVYTTEKNDIIEAKKIYSYFEQCSNVEYFEPNKTIELLDFYKNIDVAICTRMHAFIIATTQSIPSVIISWTDKIDGLMHQLGWQSRLYSVNTIYKNKENLYQNVTYLIENIATTAFDTQVKMNSIQKRFVDYSMKIKEIIDL